MTGTRTMSSKMRFMGTSKALYFSTILSLCQLFASGADAAVAFKAGTWATGTGTSNVGVTGVGFQPQVVCMWTSYPGDSGRATNDYSMAYGCMTDEGTDQQRSIWMGCASGVDPSNCNSRVRADRVLFIMSATTSTTTVCDFAMVSFDADGFTVDPGTGCTSDTTVSYWAANGLTSVALVSIAQPGSTGNFDTTSLSFQPDFLQLFSTNAIALDTDTANANFNIGMSEGTSAGLISTDCEDGTAASNCDAYTRTADAQLEILALNNAAAGVVIQRLSFVAFLSNGFTLNAVETTASATIIFALAIKGGNWAVGSFLDLATTGTISESSLTFTPVGTFVFASNRAAAQSTSDTPAASIDFSLGAGNSSSSRSVQWTRAQDAAAGNDTYRNSRASSVQLGMSTAAPPVQESSTDLTSFGANTVTFNQTDGGAASHPRFYFAVGNPNPVGTLRRAPVIIGKNVSDLPLRGLR